MSLADDIWLSLGSGTLEGEFPELSVDEGQRVQLDIVDRWAQAGHTVGGYKIGLTSGRARDSFGPGIRPFGYILQDRILASGAQLAIADLGRMGLENEVVFRIGADIRSNTADDRLVREIVDGAAPGFEINQIRLQSPAGNGVRVAENLTQWGIVHGEFMDPHQGFSQLAVTISENGQALESVSAEGHIDDHFVSIARLINRLDHFGRGLKKGDCVITGSFTRQSVTRAGLWLGDFGPLGTVELEVT